jgi:predicted nucleic acid-binding protein
MALPPRIFSDTSFFYACFDQRDVNHQRAEDLAAAAAAVGSRLYVTWDIISETLTLPRSTDVSYRSQTSSSHRKLR